MHFHIIVSSLGRFSGLINSVMETTGLEIFDD